MKLRIGYVVLVAVGAALLTGCAEKAHPKGDEPQPHMSAGQEAPAFDTSINSIELGMSQADAIARLDAMGITYSEVDNHFKTDDFRFSIRDGVVHFIEVENPSYETNRGIRVGDPVERVDEMYGAPDQHYSLGGATMEEYFDGETYLSFYCMSGISASDHGGWGVYSWGIGRVSG
ncbi:MAG: hypothetical protein FWG15_08850 [Propionibacteriaceae bacterium]|nr:hypothetical protein [Propionibacteriaceae bacterium]